MKYFIALLLVSSVGCTTSRMVFKGPCDQVINQNEMYVCGKEVVKKCSAVVGTGEHVCQK